MNEHPTPVAQLSDAPAFGATRQPLAPQPEAVVCVPTFRRPWMLWWTLQSLADQKTSRCFAVVVVDNDADLMEGAPIARAFFDAGKLSGVCVVEAQPGNCRACNRAFLEAWTRFVSASYILMIDDDEVADPEWVERMISACRTKRADIVGGPVLPQFPDNTRTAFARHPVFWPGYNRSGFVPLIFGSGNFLMRREAFKQFGPPQFDLRYNFLGGGDTEFFTRCRRSGMTFYWEEAARIFETVPNYRVRVGWVVRRGLRIGAINYCVDKSASKSVAGRMKLAAKNAALLPVSAWRALKLLAEGEPFLVSAHPIVVAIGRILVWLGFEHEQYRFQIIEPKFE